MIGDHGIFELLGGSAFVYISSSIMAFYHVAPEKFAGS